jgi:hypothetical protein
MNRLIYCGMSPGTLWPAAPLYELHQQGRFTCALRIEQEGNWREGKPVTVVNYAWTHGPFGRVVMDRVYGSSKRSQRRALVRAILACPPEGGQVTLGYVKK